MTIKSRILVVAILLFALAGTLLTGTPVAAATDTRAVAGWLPYWDHTRGLDALQSDGDQFGEVSPFWYHLSPQGAIEAYPNAEASTIRDAIRTAGALIIPTISNEFDRTRVAIIIGDATLRAAHVKALTKLTTDKGYDGFDIDYENLLAGDRTAFTTFVKELASAMRSAGKRLSITVHPKTSEPGTWDGPQAQDYAAIGAAADRVRIMAYDYHWSTSEAGAIAPASWVDQVAAFAAQSIPSSKVQLGLPLYGYDWVGTKGTGVTYDQVQALITKYSPTLQWSSADQEPWFTYQDSSGVKHTVWYANRRSTDVRLESVKRYGLGGVIFWRLGREDADVWNGTRAAFSGGTTQPPADDPPPSEDPPPADVTPPTVAITSPKPNSRVSTPRQTFWYTAADNVGVVRAELYVDGRITYSDTTGRGNFTVLTSPWSRGTHLVTVRVLDAAGNATAANVYVQR